MWEIIVKVIIDKRTIVNGNAIRKFQNFKFFEKGFTVCSKFRNVMIRMADFCNLEILSVTEISLEVQTCEP